MALFSSSSLPLTAQGVTTGGGINGLQPAAVGKRRLEVAAAAVGDNI